jgi:hypothetical protein
MPDADAPAPMPEIPAHLPSASFRYCPRCGQGPVAPPAAPLFTCPACGFQYHFNPAVAAGGIAEDREGRLASARHEVEEVLWLRLDEVEPEALAFPTTRAAFARYREERGQGREDASPAR